MEAVGKGPKCPFCEAYITNAREVQLGIKLFFLCPKCEKILSVVKA